MRPSGENRDQPLHVAPQPAQRHARPVRRRWLERLAGEHPEPQAREVHARPHRELERAPEPAVHLDQARLARTVVPELDHHGAVPAELAEQAFGGRYEPGVERDGTPQAAARSRGAHVAEPLVREPHDRPAVIAQREHSLAAPGHDALDEGPAIALAAREHCRFEFIQRVHVPRAQVGQERRPVPRVAEAGLHEAREAELQGGGPALDEGPGDASGWGGDAYCRGVPVGQPFVERRLEHAVIGAADDDPGGFPSPPLGVAEHARALGDGEDDADVALARPGDERRERLESLAREPVARPAEA